MQQITRLKWQADTLVTLDPADGTPTRGVSPLHPWALERGGVEVEVAKPSICLLFSSKYSAGRWNSATGKWTPFLRLRQSKKEKDYYYNHFFFSRSSDLENHHSKFEIVIFWWNDSVTFVWLFNLVIFKFSVKMPELTYNVRFIS